jgi:hypothetical protein
MDYKGVLYLTNKMIFGCGTWKFNLSQPFLNTLQKMGKTMIKHEIFWCFSFRHTQILGIQLVEDVTSWIWVLPTTLGRWYILHSRNLAWSIAKWRWREIGISVNTSNTLEWLLKGQKYIVKCKFTCALYIYIYICIINISVYVCTAHTNT